MASQGKAKGKKGIKSLIVLIIGAVFLILGIVWLAAIWPAVNKLPLPYDETLYFDGNMTMSNQANPQQMITIPIQEVLQQNGDDTQDGAVFMHETYTMNNTATNEEITNLRKEQTLAVDRKDLEINTDIDEGKGNRTGYWGPPRDLGKGDTWEFWNIGAHQSLTANYVKNDTFHGLDVVVFQIDERDISLEPYYHMPLLLDVTMTLTIEPKTGAVVDEESINSVTMINQGQEVPVRTTHLRYSEKTMDDLVDKAKDGKLMLTLMGTVVPWTLIGVGAVMGIVGNFFFSRARSKKLPGVSGDNG